MVNEDKEKIVIINFDKDPLTRVRITKEIDKSKALISKDGNIRTLYKDKKRFPFKIDNDVTVKITTDKRSFSIDIPSGYVWNGADIPNLFWILVGSRYNPEFLKGSLVHDYLLEHKFKIMKEVLHETVTLEEYRRLTSLVFRELIKKDGTTTLRANLMAWCIDCYQKYFNKGGWQE